MGVLDKIRERQSSERGLVKIVIGGEVYYIEDNISPKKDKPSNEKEDLKLGEKKGDK